MGRVRARSVAGGGRRLVNKLRTSPAGGTRPRERRSSRHVARLDVRGASPRSGLKVGATAVRTRLRSEATSIGASVSCSIGARCSCYFDTSPLVKLVVIEEGSELGALTDALPGRPVPPGRSSTSRSSTNEATIVDVLFRHGPIMRRDELEQRAVDERGLNRSSFYVCLGYSPILARYAPSVYGLRGAQVSAAQVDALIPPRARTQVLQDHGWTDGGDLWVAYRVSAAGERSGVLTTPGALKGVVHGDFQLFAEDERPVGTLVVEESMWGLSPFFRRFGVEEGDYLVIQISLRSRTATIYAGAADLLLRFQQAE